MESGNATRDFLARLGGEEFALLLTGTDVRTAEAMVERIRSRMPGGQTCSAGVALRMGGRHAGRVAQPSRPGALRREAGRS